VTLHAGCVIHLLMICSFFPVCVKINNGLVLSSERRLVHAQAGVLSHVRIRRELVSIRNRTTGRQNNTQTGEDNQVFWHCRITFCFQLYYRMLFIIFNYFISSLVIILSQF